jgi:hypothetical protein
MPQLDRTGTQCMPPVGAKFSEYPTSPPASHRTSCKRCAVRSCVWLDRPYNILSEASGTDYNRGS